MQHGADHATGRADRHRRSTGRARHVVPALALTLLAAGCAVADDGRPDGPEPTSSATRRSDDTTSTHGPGAPRLPAFLRPWLVVPDGADLPEARSGTVVRETRPDPVGRGGDSDSVGLLLERGGRSLWVLAVVDEDGLHVDSDRPRLSSWLTFDQWLADNADVERGGPGVAIADLDEDGVVVPVAGGARVLDQAVVADGALGALRRSGTSTAAVAIVRWEGHRWFLLAERVRPQRAPITVAASRIGFRASSAAQLLVRWERASHAP